jgi:methylthioribose-1-phosphate isomerase
VRNIAFDVTPHELIAGIITEWGTATEPFEESFKAFFQEKEAGKA